MKKTKRSTPKSKVVPYNKKRLIVLVAVSLFAIALVAYCTKKDEPVPTPEPPPSAAVVANEAQAVETVAEPPAINETTVDAEVAAREAAPVVTVRFKSPLMRSEPGIMVLTEGKNAEGEVLTFEFLWRVNGQALPDVAGATLPWDRVRRGDRISVQLVPTNGGIEGKFFAPAEITLPNAPPRFVSTPVLNFKAEEYVYEAKAEDADGDALAYTLEAGPAGMVVDGGSGRVVWRVRQDQAGEHVVKIAVADGQGGRAEQAYQLSISIQ